jgi:hypothetical protein
MQADTCVATARDLARQRSLAIESAPGHRVVARIHPRDPASEWLASILRI